MKIKVIHTERKIETIRAIREATSLGLRESKDIGEGLPYELPEVINPIGFIISLAATGATVATDTEQRTDALDREEELLHDQLLSIAGKMLGIETLRRNATGRHNEILAHTGVRLE